MSFTIFDYINAMYQALRNARQDITGLRKYNVTPLPYTSSGQVNLLKPTNGFTVFNQGTTNVTVNGTIILVPGAFIAFGGNEGEEYVGFLQLMFASNTDPGNNALVVQKYYTGGANFDKPGI